MSYILVDLDGVLAYYPPSRGQEIGAPIPKMVARVKKWLSGEKEVRIFTSRVGGGPLQAEEVVRQRALVQAWCAKHLGQPLEVTCRKDYGCVEIWSNAAIQMVTNCGERIDGCD